MSRGQMEAALEDDLSGIASLTIDELRAAWIQRFGSATPRFRSRDLLARAFTYRLQAGQHGDLTLPTRRRIAELARRFAEDRSFTPTPGPDLKPGSVLVREWGGARHEVRALDHGFSYRGEVLTSLSQAAQRITGVKWNGLVFFGLKPRTPAPRTRS
jgi:hypothetical protein